MHYFGIDLSITWKAGRALYHDTMGLVLFNQGGVK